MTKEELMIEISQAIDNGKTNSFIGRLITNYRVGMYESCDFVSLVLTCVSEVCGVSIAHIKGKSRKGNLPLARRAICHILGTETINGQRIYKHEYIGNLINLDRTMVIRNIKVGESCLLFDMVYYKIYNESLIFINSKRND